MPLSRISGTSFPRRGLRRSRFASARTRQARLSNQLQENRGILGSFIRLDVNDYGAELRQIQSFHRFEILGC